LLEVGTGFHPELTGRENVFLNGAILGMTRAEVRRKFDEIVAFAEVGQFIDTPVKRYSSGMYVRLAFAVAAHLEPEILIIDEVLAVGDMAFQQKCLGKMNEVAHQGRTVLFVSHIESAIRRLCSRVILLRSGTIVCNGSPGDVFVKYRSGGQQTGFSAAERTKSSDQIRITHAFLSIEGQATESLLAGGQPKLVVHIEASTQITISVEIVLRDANSNPVMFGPVGLAQGFKQSFMPGHHTLSFDLYFPQLAEGRYALDLLLVESGIQTYECLEAAITFDVLPTHNLRTGWRFRQATGQGSILLETSVPVINGPSGHSGIS
jgi:lipopolysaccharide transport system ATP-binding protein